MKSTEFTVSRFVNRNGITSWRVSGWLHGIRIRKNLKTREEAIAEKGALDLRSIQADAGLRPATTFLEPDQLREAEALFRRLIRDTRSLTFYFEYAFENYREPEQRTALDVAIGTYLAIKARECERTLLSSRQLRSIRNELDVLKRHFPSGPVSRFTPEQLTTYLERGNPSLKTYNNRRGLLSTFFKFALQKDWILTNPVEKTPHHRINHRRGSAVTISAQRHVRVGLPQFMPGSGPKMNEKCRAGTTLRCRWAQSVAEK
jgi:hypothetical protein